VVSPSERGWGHWEEQTSVTDIETICAGFFFIGYNYIIRVDKYFNLLEVLALALVFTTYHRLKFIMGKLNIAHHKSYHPYRRDNIEKVRKDEEEAKQKEAREEGRIMLAVRPLNFVD
jgi:hypothetical protein